MLPRVLEPEVMDELADALDYDAMDHTEVNQRFVSDLFGAWESRCLTFTSPDIRILNKEQAPILFIDLGSGTARIPIELCRAWPRCHVLAVEPSEAMRAIAADNLESAGLSEQITLVAGSADEATAEALLGEIGRVEFVLSNSLVHHVPQPVDVLTMTARLLLGGGLAFHRDLVRPDTAEEVEALVRRYAGDQTTAQQQLLRQSLHASLTLDEVRDLAGQTLTPEGFDWSVEQTSDRHWTLIAVRRVHFELR